jgi:hypothetical protein
MGDSARTIQPSRLEIVAMVMEAIDQLQPVELLVIEDFLARKRENDRTARNTAAAGASARVVPMEDVQAGSTGSQPIQSPPDLDHVTEVEKTWVYEDDNGDKIQMLNQQWIESLNDNDANLESFSTKLTFDRSVNVYVVKEYEVDIDAMTSTNKESKHARALQRMQLRILLVDDMLEAETTAPFIALLNNGWKMRWQSKEVCGWKNVSAEGNEILCNWLASPNVLEEWVHPRDGKEQLLRLVALKEWCKG